MRAADLILTRRFGSLSVKTEPAGKTRQAAALQKPVTGAGERTYRAVCKTIETMQPTVDGLYGRMDGTQPGINVSCRYKRDGGIARHWHSKRL